MLKNILLSLFRREHNRRHYLRLKVHHLLRYKILRRKDVLTPSCFIRDISAGGARIFSEEYIPQESIIELKVKFPMFSDPIPVLSRVVRVGSCANGFEMGVEFIELNDEIKKTIAERIESVYHTTYHKRGGGDMKSISIICVIMAVLGVIAAATLRFKMCGMVLPASARVWMEGANTCLLLAIAVSLLGNKTDE